MIMKKAYSLLPLLLTATYSLADSDFALSKYRCAGIEQRIDNINSKMRAGYSTREGEQLKKQRYECKKKGLSVN